MTENIDDKLLAEYRCGDEEAAAKLFERYYDRLIRLVAQSRNKNLRRLEGDSDLVQSVFATLFRRGRKGQIELGKDATLWPILVTIALNKVRNQGKFWTRAKRNVGRNVDLDAVDDPLVRDPTPDEVAVVKETTELLLDQFSKRRRRILELLLEGYEIDEVVLEVGTSRFTVYKTRQAAAKLLEAILQSN